MPEEPWGQRTANKTNEHQCVEKERLTLDVLMYLDPKSIPQILEDDDIYSPLFKGYEAERAQAIVRTVYGGAVGLTAEEIEWRVKKEAAIALVIKWAPAVRQWDLPIGDGTSGSTPILFNRGHLLAVYELLR